MEIVLASNSPRRKELLGLTNLDFRVVPADVDETPHKGESPSDYVLRLAASKAQAVSNLLDGNPLVIAADTTVADGIDILGKPGDAAEAERILRQLRDKKHQVFTALAVAQKSKLVTDLSCSDVPMRDYSDEEMHAYIGTGDPMDKAGAYAIQHAGFHPAENFSDCFANVMGFPLCHLYRTLKKFDICLPDDLPQICQNTIEYSCSIYEKILRDTL